MKGKVKYMQKRTFDPIMFSRKGEGRIDENIPIDLLEYVTPRPAEALDNSNFCCIPTQLSVSEEINGTIYDVTGVFTGKMISRCFSSSKNWYFPKT